MPGYFPKEKGWPAIAKTTPGLIRGTAHKQLDRYIPHMNEAISSQLGALKFTDGGLCPNTSFLSYNSSL